MKIDQNLCQLQDGWMRRNARELDLARWDFLIGKGEKQAVVDALAAYQNPDGGFGHALEPDCWNPNSSPLQTWTATTILREIDLYDPTNPLVASLVKYLLATLADGVWQTIIPSNNDYPRAPWWTFEPAAALWDYNPTAGLLGYLARTGTVLDDEIKKALASYLGRLIDNMHELRLFVDLCEDLDQINWQRADIDKMQEKLAEDCQAVVETDVNQWSGYVTRPSAIVRTRLPSYLDFLRPMVEQEKEYLLETVDADGTWKVSWEWGQYREEFAVAKNWWKANLILQYDHFLAL